MRHDLHFSIKLAIMSGLGTVLRASGSKASVETFLTRTKWSPLSVFWKGKKRSDHAPVSKINGFNVNVSDADGLELPKKVKDAVRMLRRDAMRISKAAAVEAPCGARFRSRSEGWGWSSILSLSVPTAAAREVRVELGSLLLWEPTVIANELLHGDARNARS
jgi:hypothetical protein